MHHSGSMRPVHSAVCGSSSVDTVENEPTELTDAALWVKGTTSSGVTFELQVTEESTLSLAGPFTLPEGSHLLQVAFYLDEWFSGIDESALVNGLSESDSAAFNSQRTYVGPSFPRCKSRRRTRQHRDRDFLAYGE